MTLTLDKPLSWSAMDEFVDKIYASALEEHTEFIKLNRTALRLFLKRELTRINTFEAIGRAPLSLTPEDAEAIGAIKVHSSVGSWDEPYKDEDNPRLKGISWLAWADRSRVMHGFNLAWHVAQLRSGITAPVDILDSTWSPEAIQQLIRDFGPNVIYTGYPVETHKLEEVLNRPGELFPRDKAFIVHDNPKNTVEAAQKFKMPAGALPEGKKLVVVSHAPHLVRVLHIAGKYPYLPNGEWFYVSPVATQPSGREEFALMELRGMLFYIFLALTAAERVPTYKTL